MIRLYPDNLDTAIDVPKADIKNVERINNLETGNYIIKIEMNNGKVYEESYNVFPFFGEPSWEETRKIRNIRYVHITKQILGGNE